MRIGVGGFEFGKLEKKYLNRIIRSNRLSYGPFSVQFEKEFASAHDCQFGIFCNSGTSALHIALAALKEEYHWKDGDEIIVPSVTFVATVNIILHNRMTPVFVDVDQWTYNLNPTLIEEKITSRTRAIIPVHLTGLPCDMDSILEIAQRRNLKIIEDSCETTFGSYKGKKVGSMGEIGCFSTYIAHYITTGVGGLALTNNTELAIKLRSLMNHGRDSIYIQMDDDRKISKEKLHEIIAKRFSFVSVGHSFRCTEFEAALGLAQLENKESIISKRQMNGRMLSLGLSDLQDILQLPLSPSESPHMFMMYPIVLKNGDKTKLVNFLEERGIETRDLLPITNQPVYKELFGSLEKDHLAYPIADWINRHGFYIGCHQFLTGKDIEKIIHVIHGYFKR